MKARILSILLALCLLVSLIPAAGLADSIDIDLGEGFEIEAEEAAEEVEEAPAEVEEAEAPAPEEAAPQLLLKELAEVYAGDALTVDYLYTGKGELTITWQALAGEDEWVELDTPFKAEEGVSYRCVVTDGELTAISTITTALPVPAEEEADTPVDIAEAEEDVASKSVADVDKNLSGTSWVSVPFTTISVGDYLYVSTSVEGYYTYSKAYFADGGDYLYAKKKGTTTIKVYNEETGATKTVKITIKAKPSSLTITNSSLNCNVWTAIKIKGNTGGSTYAENVKAAAGTTCSYDYEDGYIKPTSAGKLCLVAYNRAGTKSKTKTFTIKEEPSSSEMYVQLMKEFGGSSYYPKMNGNLTLSVAKGDYAKVKFSFASGYGGTSKIYSTNTSVAKYKSGKISFVGIGEAAIVFEAYNGEYRVVYLNVQAKPTIGATLDIPGRIANINYKDFNPYDLIEDYCGRHYNYMHMTLSSSNKKVIKTSGVYSADPAELRYTAAKTGSATLTLKLYTGAKSKKKVTSYANKVIVNSKPTSADLKEKYAEDGKTLVTGLYSVEIVGKNKIKCTYYAGLACPKKLKIQYTCRPGVYIDFDGPYQVSKKTTKKFTVKAYGVTTFSQTLTTSDINWNNVDLTSGDGPIFIGILA